MTKRMSKTFRFSPRVTELIEHESEKRGMSQTELIEKLVGGEVHLIGIDEKLDEILKLLKKKK